ncbi:MAG: efflux RND transporter periplasmic adaptor subunit [Phycisphaerales bacterium]|nr:efflux RND transporter periplasmic adaptor subunit [Phycisphaerales bacterium]
MNRGLVVTIVAVVATGLGLVGGILAEREGLVPWRTRAPGRVAEPAPANPDNASEQARPVRVARTVAGHLQQTAELLGSVERMPGATETQTLACDVRIVQAFAVAGQQVDLGAPMLHVEPTRGVLSQIDEAQAGVDAAEAALGAANARLEARLGTRTDVVQAEQQLRTARVHLDSLRRALPAEGGLIAAPRGGVVLSAGSPAGSVVPAGEVLFEVAGRDDVAVRFGVPLDAVEHVYPGTSVRVSAPMAASLGEVELTLDRLEPAVDPDSRVVTGWTTRIGPDSWLPGTPVRVVATFASRDGMLVPRGALVLGDEGAGVFVVRGGVAKRLDATLLAGNSETVCIEAAGLAPGDSVVTQGGPELEDGVAVRVEGGR